MKKNDMNICISSTYTLPDAKSEKGMAEGVNTRLNIHFCNPNTDDGTRRYMERIFTEACCLKLEEELLRTKTIGKYEENPVA